MAETVAGLLEQSSEREFITLILGALISGVLTFALGWGILRMARDVQMRSMDSLDKAVARRGDEPADGEGEV